MAPKYVCQVRWFILASLALAIGALFSLGSIADGPSTSLRTSQQSGHRHLLPSKVIEVVLAHDDENLDWIKEALHLNPDVRYTIYSKATQPPSGAQILPNVGREGHTFLHHIVQNYNNLADWTVFSQAAAACTTKTEQVCPGATWEEYLKPYPNGEDFFMVHTVATAYPRAWHSSRVDVMFDMPSSKGDTCPAEGENGWTHWWTIPDHPFLKFESTEKANDSLSFAMDFYNTYVVADASNIEYKSVTLTFANGGRFAISKERIHRRPLSYYKDLLGLLSRHVNPVEGYYFESMLYDVFHPDHLQAEYGPICKLPSFGEGAVDLDTMRREAATRIFGQDKVMPRELMLSGSYLDTVAPDLIQDEPILQPTSLVITNEPPSPAPVPFSIGGSGSKLVREREAED